MKCIRCGSELIDHVLTCPNCGFEHDDDQSASADSPVNETRDPSEMEDKKDKNLASELKSKIKKAFYIDHNNDEAMNLIELYLSMIGIDAEIIEYQEKIQNKRREGEKASEINKKEISIEGTKPDKAGSSSEELMFELEVESSEIPEPPATEKLVEDEGPEEPSPIEANHQFFELEDEEFPEEELEKELEIEISSEDLEELVPDAPILPGEEDQEDGDMLVLEPNEEILELEDEVIEPQKTEKDDFEKPRDLSSQFEIEINQASQKQAESSSDDILNLSEFESEMGEAQKEDIQKEPEEFVSEKGEIKDPLTEIPESIESMLDNIKIKKKKIQRLLMIAAAVIAFIALIITLYILTTKKHSDNQVSRPVAKKHATLPKTIPVEKKEDPAISTQEQEYQKYLMQAESYFQKGDLENAEKSIKFAKKIKETQETQKMEQGINQQKIEETILNDKQEKTETPSISDEERSYKRAIASSDISVLEAHLKKYPAGEYSGEIIKRIEELKKKNREMLEQQIKQNFQLYQKIKLRSSPQVLTTENIQEILKKIRNIPERIETKIIADDKVLINYSTGLMWHIWKESMEFRKAKWWANREYAGYFNWRLPTAEEAATLTASEIPMLLDKPKAVIEIWTSDIDRSDSTNIWVFLPFEGIFKIFGESDYKQVCSVRSL